MWVYGEKHRNQKKQFHCFPDNHIQTIETMQ